MGPRTCNLTRHAILLPKIVQFVLWAKPNSCTVMRRCIVAMSYARAAVFHLHLYIL